VVHVVQQEREGYGARSRHNVLNTQPCIARLQLPVSEELFAVPVVAAWRPCRRAIPIQIRGAVPDGRLAVGQCGEWPLPPSR
jgi:hypothetical protein